MGNIAPAMYMLAPNYVEPGLIVPYVQASGAFALLYDGQPLPRLSAGTLMVYAKRIEVRTKVAAGQSAYNQIPSVSTKLDFVKTATYLMRVRAEYDHHDTAAMGQWGVSIVEAQRLGMRQGHFQLARSALLYGFNPGYGEGLLNTQGATSVSLPADSNGNQTIASYDNGQMAIFLLGVIQGLKARTYQHGIGRKFTMCGPMRTLSQFAYQNIVQVTQFQREGGGTTNTKGVVDASLAANGDELEWVYDDTLIGKGAGGTDAIVVTMPELQKPLRRSPIDTNAFADIAPGLMATTLMYCDTAAPVEIPTPLPGGAIDIVSEWRISSGWGLRPEAVTVISAQFQ